MNAKKLFGIAVYYSGLYALLKLIARKKLVVYVYHRINYMKSDNLDPYVKSATPAEFEKQVRFIKKNFNVTSFEEVDSIKGNCAIITFDDGYLDNYTYAYPVLKKYKCPATILLTTGYINSTRLPWWDRIAYAINNTKLNKFYFEDIGILNLKDKKKAIMRLQNYIRRKKNREVLVRMLEKRLGIKYSRKRVFLNWKEIREMAENRISFGAHTVTHPILVNLTAEKARKEILRSKAAIEKELMKRVIVFAYPNGHNEDMSHGLDRYLKKIGIRYSLTAIYGSNNKTAFRIKRVGIEYDDDFRTFRFKALGTGSWIAPLYLRLRGWN